MRNYTPQAPSGDPLNKELSYTFNNLVCRFTSEELSKFLRDEASRVSRESEAELAKLPAVRKRAQEEPEDANRHGLSREELLKAVDDLEETEKARAARVVQQLNFVADHLAKDAVFELDAREVLSVVGQFSEERHGMVRAIGRLRDYRVDKMASKTLG